MDEATTNLSRDIIQLIKKLSSITFSYALVEFSSYGVLHFVRIGQSLRESPREKRNGKRRPNQNNHRPGLTQLLVPINARVTVPYYRRDLQDFATCQMKTVQSGQFKKLFTVNPLTGLNRTHSVLSAGLLKVETPYIPSKGPGERLSLGHAIVYGRN